MKKLFQWLTTIVLFSIVSTAIADETPLKITVGTEGTMRPFTYHDENNQLTGFDIDVIRAIAETDPNLKVVFKTGVWDTLFPGLDAGHIDTIANQVASTPERLERYYLTKQHYFNDGSQAIVLKNQVDKYPTLNDLKGKRVAVGVGTNHSRSIEDWNSANGNEVNIVYFDGEVGLMFRDLTNYRVAAVINSPVTALEQAQANKLEIALVGEPIHSSPIHFVFQRSERGKAIQKRIDAGLEKIKESGKLRDLSIQYFGEDLTK